MKKYYITATLIMLSAIIYIVLIGKIEGSYTSNSYTMLDGGYSESFLIFKNNSISHVYIEPGKSPLVKIIGSYSSLGYSSILVNDSNLGTKYTLNAGVLGLYMQDSDAKRLVLKFPRIGNIWCLRRIE